MMTSARNQFTGTILKIEPGAVNSDMAISIGNAVVISASIPNTAVEELGLEPGISVYILIKASSVVIMPDDVTIKVSCPNRLRGTVSECVRGTVNGIIKMDIGGGKILTAVITNESIDDLSIKIGKSACALVNQTQVIIAATGD